MTAFRRISELTNLRANQRHVKEDENMIIVTGRKQLCLIWSTGICLGKTGETTDLRIFGNKVVNPTLVLSQL